VDEPGGDASDDVIGERGVPMTTDDDEVGVLVLTDSQKRRHGAGFGDDGAISHAELS
jgi:hypothetical protein